ncbi:dienelactone hydrolase family protein [Duganella sp. HH101]|uniref:alpha/beta hydrolase family protein n=1 Tax=Duganella sp. HH101 TaxID=1781066 RepID=UPI0008931903|nr:hypothetical protein [Duganella sp. HH101]OEZ97578.1 alpha/beta hydrolase family protein [Duganella sp. HH101]
MKNIRILHVVFSLLVTLCTHSVYAVGFQHRTLEGSGLEVGIWYPSTGKPTQASIGLVAQNVAANGPLEGDHLPLIVISHGTGSSFLGHYDTAIALAEAGYVVAAVTHAGDNYADQSRSAFIMDRPKQISLVIDYMVGSWKDHAQIDPARIGMFGFSAGGFTALVSIGGVPDLKQIVPFCREHIGDFACQMLRRQTTAPLNLLAAQQTSVSDARIRAAVVAAPALGFTFAGQGLQRVTVPVQLWRAEDDTLLPHPWYAEIVRAALPRAPEYHVVPNAGHFDFLAPCNAALTERAPAICQSIPGFDRMAFHSTFNASVLGFFNKALRSTH